MFILANENSDVPLNKANIFVFLHIFCINSLVFLLSLTLNAILDNIKLGEIWGNEISLEYENKFAGTCDLTAICYGKPSIVDWKQTNKPKKEEWVEDYKLQLGAYYLAHTKNYGPIEQGVISMCTRALQYQEFKLNEPQLKEYGDKFLERVETFNKITKASS